MVNFVESFTRMYGRKPSESETAFMMRVKAERDARINKDISPKSGLMEASRKSQHHARIAAENRKKKSAINVPARAYTINKLLQLGFDQKLIADVLDVNEGIVNQAVLRYRLPRKDVQKVKK